MGFFGEGFASGPVGSRGGRQTTMGSMLQPVLTIVPACHLDQLSASHL